MNKEYSIEELKIKTKVYEIILNDNGFDKLVELKNPISTKRMNIGPFDDEKGYTVTFYYETIKKDDGEYSYRMIPKELLLFSHKVV